MLLNPDRAGVTMRLSIYVSNHCTNCREARAIAAQARGIPDLEVAVINLDDPGRIIPPRVVAAPTYLLDGRVVSLGNPDRVGFLDELARRVRENIAW